MMKRACFFASGIMAALGPMLAAAESWETRVYRTWLPLADMNPPDDCPEAPANPTPETIRTFLRESHRWVERALPPGMLTPGVLCAYDPGTHTLAARVIPGSWTDGVIRGLPEPEVPKFLVHELTVFEGEADQLRGWMEGLGAIRNHQEALDQLEAWTASGETRRVSVTRIESRSGQRAEVTSLGALSLEGTIGPDGTQVDTNLVLQWPEASGQMRLAGHVSGHSGEPRLIGAWNPDGDRDLLQVALLVPTVATLLPAANEALARWIEAEGDTVAPPPPATAEMASPSPPPDGMEVRRFRVPPSFLHTRDGGNDPFADLGSAPPRVITETTARAVLEKIGVTFPEGAYAQYDGITSQLVVCNTRPNLDLTEAYVGFGGCCDCPTPVTATVHVVEAPTARVVALLRQADEGADHSAAWKALTDQPDTRILTTILVPGRSGETPKFEAGRQAEEDGTPTGTTLELCPTIGPDGWTLDARISLRHDRAKLVTDVTQHHGTTRLLGIWKPAGAPADLHRAAFLRLELSRED